MTSFFLHDAVTANDAKAMDEFLELCEKVGGAFKDHLNQRLVDTFKSMMADRNAVEASHSHRDISFALGPFDRGSFDDSVVPGHILYTVKMSTLEEMKLRDIAMIEVHLSTCCEFMSRRDANQYVMWVYESEVDSKNKLCVMFGSNARHIVLTFELIDWCPHVFQLLRARIISCGSSSPTFDDAMAAHNGLFQTIVFHGTEFRDQRIELTSVSFRVRPVRKMIACLDKGSSFSSDFQSALLKDYLSISFDSRIAKLIGCPMRETMRF